MTERGREHESAQRPEQGHGQGQGPGHGRTRVLIAGGGIGGLALAHALRRGGLQVSVYEKGADPRSFFPVAIRAGERIEPRQSGPVTLLGDAVHTMPPTGGIGASTALQDAASLAAELLAADCGERPLVDAIAAYERVMLPRGFANIDQSLRNAEMMFPGSMSAPMS